MHVFDVFPFNAADGFKCNLWHLKIHKATPKGPVLLVHGAGVSSNIFNAPNKKNLLHCLSEAGYDVWLENWRGSTACEINDWNLDLAACHDHPAAVREVCRRTDSKTLKAIIHGQGSASFMISAIKGLVPQVVTIVSNAVSLHPVVSDLVRFKLTFLPPFIKPFSASFSPRWGYDAPGIKAKLLRIIVNITHRENDTDTGKLVSFTYGAGHPALWKLNNMTDPAKNWLRDEFGYIPLSFFDHIKKCIRAGVLVSADGRVNYAATAPQTTARFAFFAGRLNKCFLSKSQQNSYNYFNSYMPNYHKLHLLDGYSHLDIFFGENACRDVFPAMISELNN